MGEEDWSKYLMVEGEWRSIRKCGSGRPQLRKKCEG